MTQPELAQLDLLAQTDEIVRKLDAWSREESAWEPLGQCRALVRRVLSRIESLRIRLEAPLVVATFGGTGTGKSSLVNALVGREVARTGRQRPTTTKPTLLAGPQADLSAIGFPLDDFEVVQVDSPMLRQIVLIDCPDPDTSESNASGGNLHRLQQLLPHCDVLIYTSTQQKYRSGRVLEELGLAATGCRLLFVQTHADLDDDIRDDWRRSLASHFEVPDVFFVDSVRGLREQLAGERPSGDLGRLQDVLATQLSEAHRVQIRRANLIDLLDAVLIRCRGQLAEHEPELRELEEAIEAEHQKLVRSMADHLGREMSHSGPLWERRLLGSVSQAWGLSPFSTVLRLYNALGGVLASVTLYRARTSAHVAVIGAFQGARWLKARQQERDSASRLERLTSTSADDNLLREAQLLVGGYVKSARFDPALIQQASLDALRGQALQVEEDFLADAGGRIDRIVDELVERRSRPATRWFYEALFIIYPAFVLYRVGKNFFYDTFLHGAAYLGTDFYISAALFLILWTWLLVATFSRGMRRQLEGRIDEVARSLAERRLSGGLFPRLEEACREVRLQEARLDAIAATANALKREIAIDSLGAPRLPSDHGLAGALPH